MESVLSLIGGEQGAEVAGVLDVTVVLTGLATSVDLYFPGEVLISNPKLPFRIGDIARCFLLAIWSVVIAVSLLFILSSFSLSKPLASSCLLNRSYSSVRLCIKMMSTIQQCLI